MSQDSPLRRAKLRQLFQIYDADGNGVLEQVDFLAVVERFATARGLDSESDAHRRLQELYLSVWDELQREADADGDGQVTLQEMRSYLDRVTHDPALFVQQVLTITELLFGVLDANSDGLITEKEYLEFASCLGFKADSEVFARLSPPQGMTEVTLRQRITEFYFSEQQDAPGNWLFGRLEEVQA